MSKEDFCTMVDEVVAEVSEEKGIALEVINNGFAILVGRKSGGAMAEFEFREMVPGVWMTPAQVEESIGYIV